ncbi:hypothetical protein [Ruegeria sp. TM1040]|uniref:hypothetical protein n=1 Tax=Ruegeria sp. (strain TM1040) TaxID=292414 RepID=UPI00004624B5|nr:hypothetical protein [Ruegeria sp. TM1040]
MSDTETKGGIPSVDDGNSVEQSIVAKFGSKLSTFEITVRHLSSNREVKRRYEFRQDKATE